MVNILHSLQALGQAEILQLFAAQITVCFMLMLNTHLGVTKLVGTR